MGEGRFLMQNGRWTQEGQVEIVEVVYKMGALPEKQKQWVNSEDVVRGGARFQQ